jgi:hypothetical protein
MHILCDCQLQLMPPHACCAPASCCATGVSNILSCKPHGLLILLLLCCLQLCVRLCEGYKQQYIALRDAAKLDNPDKVRCLPASTDACADCQLQRRSASHSPGS